ncbi:hypothetical protein, partial [Actinoalloteichus caeruleus]|uniref:hypothetical protein n=1 Tax=Actinoalloteichus cyanogriseus TaxID=2893586 RepID=UPI0012DFC14F
MRSVLLLGKRVQAQLHSPRSTPQRSTPRVSRTYNGYTAQQVATTHATLADTRSVIDVVLDAGGKVLSEVLGLDDIKNCFTKADI